MSTDLALGIDTSAYTTSLALVDTNGRLRRDVRRVLAVESGSKGLRQADALFQHVRHLPALLEQAFTGLPHARIAAVAVSSAPRPVSGSYMPVFLAGRGVAAAAAVAAGVPLWEVTHQEGHLWSALWSLGDPDPALLTSPFLYVHLSGGTTEALRVEGGDTPADRPHLTLLGATADISAGQFVDRVGTALGLQFPAGPHLQELARQGSPGEVQLRPAVAGEKLSFSGPESAAARAVAAGAPPADVAWAVFDCLAASLERWLATLARRAGIKQVVLAGGVAASSLLRERLLASRKLARCRLWFAQPRYSSDNAVGLASWAAARLQGAGILTLPQRGQAGDQDAAGFAASSVEV